MADFEKMEGQEIENISGGAGYNSNIRTVFVQSGYLAVRTAPAYRYENEIQSTKLYTGDTVEITGSYVQGTGFGGCAATYVWVFAPKFGVSGYVNAAFIG